MFNATFALPWSVKPININLNVIAIDYNDRGSHLWANESDLKNILQPPNDISSYYNSFVQQGTPRAYTDLVLNATGPPGNIANYNISSNMFDDYSVTVMDYDILNDGTANLMAPFVNLVLVVLAFIVPLSILVSFFLIFLILHKNREMIHVLTMMVSHHCQITLYIITGYIFATLLATIFAVGLSIGFFIIMRQSVVALFGIYLLQTFEKLFFLALFVLPTAIITFMSSCVAVYARSVRLN